MKPTAPSRVPAWLHPGFGTDAPASVLRQVSLVNVLLLFSALFSLTFGWFAWRRGDLVPAILDASMAGLMGFMHLHLRIRKNLERTASMAVLLGGVFLWLLVLHGSVMQSGFVWIVIYPAVALFSLGARRGSVAAATLFFGVLAVFILSHHLAVYLLIYFFTLLMEVTRTHFLARQEEARGEQERQARLLEQNNEEKAALIDQLERNLREVRALRGLLPICTDCGKLRDDEGYWQELGAYLHETTGTELTHGICPDCARELYAEFMPEKK
jgi:hypothetical protein